MTVPVVKIPQAIAYCLYDGILAHIMRRVPLIGAALCLISLH